MKKLFIVLTAFLCFSSHAETLFIKPNGQDLLDEEHAVVYQIMLETQFPMSLLHGTFAEDEIGEMNRKISAQLPGSGITAQFIPTTLYEVLALRLLQDNCTITLQNLAHFEQTRQDLVKSITGGIAHIAQAKFTGHATFKYDCTVEGQGAQSAFNTNHVKAYNIHMRTFHKNVNEFIGKTVREKNITLNSPAQAKELLATIPLSFTMASGLKRFPLKMDILAKAIDIEYNAMSKGAFPLYRGTSAIDWEPEKQFVHYKGNTIQGTLDPNRALSFGSSLLAGIMKDAIGTGGACAYAYICCTASLGYALIIDKARYANGPLNNMFWIPSSTTLNGLFGSGEEFHARSRIVDPLKCHLGIVGQFNPADAIQIKAESCKQAEEIYKAMLSYIRDNHIMITKDRSITP